MLGTMVNFFYVGDKKKTVKQRVEPRQIDDVPFIPYKEWRGEESLRGKEWLFSNTIELGDSGCWVWTGGVSEKGNPSFHGKRVHQMAWQIFKLGSTVGHVVQECGNPLCVFPNHFNIIQKGN